MIDLLLLFEDFCPFDPDDLDDEELELDFDDPWTTFELFELELDDPELEIELEPEEPIFAAALELTYLELELELYPPELEPELEEPLLELEA